MNFRDDRSRIGDNATEVLVGLNYGQPVYLTGNLISDRQPRVSPVQLDTYMWVEGNPGWQKGRCLLRPESELDAISSGMCQIHRSGSLHSSDQRRAIRGCMHSAGPNTEGAASVSHGGVVTPAANGAWSWRDSRAAWTAAT